MSDDDKKVIAALVLRLAGMNKPVTLTRPNLDRVVEGSLVMEAAEDGSVHLEYRAKLVPNETVRGGGKVMG